MSQYDGMTKTELEKLRRTLQKTAGQSRVRLGDRDVSLEPGAQRTAEIAKINRAIATLDGQAKPARRVRMAARPGWR